MILNEVLFIDHSQAEWCHLAPPTSSDSFFLRGHGLSAP
jgi:hypothetical protein